MPPSVLIVDDDVRFRSLAGMILGERGFDVVAEAGDGAAALAAVERHRPDCVLCDVQLPDTDGFTLARAIRAAPPRPRVLLTSSDPDLGIGATATGAEGFVCKTELPRADLRGYLT